ncbi:hypothetical protein LguiB_031767 [Lonicera macranthoides]
MAKHGKRSRLWCSEQALKLWEGHMVTLDVEALNLNLHEDLKFRPQCLVIKDFKKLRNLRFLGFGRADLDDDFKQYLSNLRWVDWEFSANQFLERLSHHRCDNLVEIDPSIWNLSNLRALDLSNSRGLKTLDCSSILALENLNLSDCEKLHRLGGLGKLKLLRYLNMDRYCDLEILLDLSNFKKLKKLDIVGCKKLTEMKGLDT